MNQPHDRPPEFDRLLVAYLPGLRKRASLLTDNRELAERILGETIIIMLKEHDRCHMDTFYTWATLTMRRVASAIGKELRREKRSGTTVSIEKVADRLRSTHSQNGAIELAEVRSHLAARKYGSVLLRHLSGERAHDIAAQMGKSHAWAFATIANERALLVEKFGEAA